MRATRLPLDQSSHGRALDPEQERSGVDAQHFGAVVERRVDPHLERLWLGDVADVELDGEAGVPGGVERHDVLPRDFSA